MGVSFWRLQDGIVGECFPLQTRDLELPQIDASKDLIYYKELSDPS